MLHIDNETLGKAVKKTCKFAAVGLLLATRVKIEKVDTNEWTNVFAGYGDAIEAISKSTMFSSQKREAISAVKKDGTTDYYKAIISITNNSNMFSSDKLNTIKNLSK